MPPFIQLGLLTTALQSRIYSKQCAMGEIIKVLCLEDQEEDFELITVALVKSGIPCGAIRVDTRDEFIRAIGEYVPDIILSDHALPQFNSFEALKICRQQNRIIPFILVTGAVSEEFAVECMKHGAQDYVLKSNLTRLPNSVRNALKHRDLEQEKSFAALQLAQQNKDLFKINGELDSFVYSVSHNLRAPLMSLLGLLNLTKHVDHLDIIRDYHAKMERTIYKLDETLKEILDYSRNTRQELEIERVDLKEIITENIDKLRYMPSFERLVLKMKINRATLFFTDRYRLSVILNNLISNAIKYQDVTKKISYLHITCEVSADRVTLQFSDNGIGIAEDLLAKVFHMFFRATEKADGSGLGLYIVKEAVDRLHGTIAIESSLGMGTTFKLELPNNLL